MKRVDENDSPKEQHAQIQQWLAIYPDLSPNQRVQVDEHLAACAECAATWQTDQEMNHALHLLMERRRQQLALQPAADPHHAMARFQDAVRRSGWQSGQAWGTTQMPQARPRWLAVAAALLLLLFLSMGLGQVGSGISLLTNVYATGTPPISTSKEVEIQTTSGIEAALGRELGVWGAQDASSFDRFIDPAADEAWRSRARDVMRNQFHWHFQHRPTLRLSHVEMLADDMALVRIELEFPLQNGSISVGRLYRQHEDGRWYWSQPHPELWGEARTLETDHLVFAYQAGDAAVIEEIAPRLEAAYLAIHDYLQLDPNGAGNPQDYYFGRKLTLEIVPVDTIIEREPGLTYAISSPRLFLWQQTATPLAESYAAVLLTRLTVDLVAQAQEQLNYPARGWDEVEMAVVRWMVDESLATSYWQQLYGDSLLPSLLTNHATLRLDDVSMSPTNTQTRFQHGGIHAASSALIRYIVATHGREMIPTLVRALVGEADTWEALIPHLFGVSRADFEAAWNGWLYAEYPAVQETLDVRAGVEAALALEFATRRQNDAQQVDRYLDLDADEEWLRAYYRASAIGRESTQFWWRDYEIVELVIDGDLARVRVLITNNSTLQPQLIEGRFYRRVGERWLLTAPDINAWGMLYTLETPHFSIQYRALDAGIVEAAVGELERAYVKMLDTLALPEERPEERYRTFYNGKFHYAIVPEEVDNQPASTTYHKISSPFFQTLPNEMDTASQLAYTMIVHSYGLSLLDEVYGQPTSEWWAPISIGINQWVLEDSLVNPPWRWSDYMRGLIQEFVDHAYPVTMDEIVALPQSPQGQAAGTLLMDYIAAVHGRTSIAPFMRSLNQAEGWGELIPAVFGVSVKEFETGWNEWIRARYVSPLDSSL